MELRLDKVQVEGNDLLFVEALVQEKRLKMLVDSGATHSIVRRALLAAPAGTHEEIIQTRDFEGRLSRTSSRKFTVEMTFDDRLCSVELVEWPLRQDFDGILGQSWLRRENPDIDWTAGTLSWRRPTCRNLPREWTPPPPGDPEIEYVDADEFETSRLGYTQKFCTWMPLQRTLPTKIQWVPGGDPSKPVRWVIDYRYVNSATKIPRIPIPRIHEVFDRLAGAHVFTLIDLASGYHQMRMAFDSRQYTAFRAGSEIYQWCVAPMGLAGMPGTWSRLMRRIFESKELSAFVVVYLGDICVISKNQSDPLQHLRRVFEVLRSEQRYARPTRNKLAEKLKPTDHLWRHVGMVQERAARRNVSVNHEPVSKQIAPAKQANSTVIVQDSALWLGSILLRLMNDFHDAAVVAHPGVERTMVAMHQYFWWPGMREHIAQYISTGEACVRNKSGPRRRKGLLQHLPVPDHCWQHVTMDFVTALPISDGFDAIYVVVRRLSNRPCYIPTTNGVDAKTTARLFFDHVVRYYSLPVSTVSDRDPKFTSEFWRELMAIMQVKKRMTVSKRAHVDGRSERQIGTLEDSLRCVVSQYGDNWLRMLPTVEYAHATLVSTSTRISPFEVDCGRKPCSQIVLATSGSLAQNMTRSCQEVIELAQRNMRLAKERHARYYNRGRQQVQFKVGDLVYADARVLSSELGQPDYDPERNPTCNKLLPKWYDPFLVEQRIGENSIASNCRIAIWPVDATPHVDQLKFSLDVPEIFSGHKITKGAPRRYDEDGERVYVIRTLLDQRLRGGRKQYYCSWVGLPESENSWEFEDDINHVSHWDTLLKVLEKKRRHVPLARRRRADLLKTKGEAAEHIRLFTAEFERQFNVPVKYIRTDGGGEFPSRPFQHLVPARESSISLPRQTHRRQMARRNYSIAPLTGRPPSVAHILKFRSKCTLHVANKKTKSLRKRAERAVVLVVSPVQKGYGHNLPRTKKITVCTSIQNIEQLDVRQSVQLIDDISAAADQNTCADTEPVNNDHATNACSSEGSDSGNSLGHFNKTPLVIQQMKSSCPINNLPARVRKCLVERSLSGGSQLPTVTVVIAVTALLSLRRYFRSRSHYRHVGIQDKVHKSWRVGTLQGSIGCP
ncbi:unnamed protein product [Phytophthora fragariaefolia]|uniref:Unnamed protein product n=1 Tax=Phytophthora fragariaefolia TaxID=1490495 RepID=A0A9W6XJR5_9STRA|nr:unnamed protein product [Phytophthora fragariaefolia]